MQIIMGKKILQIPGRKRLNYKMVQRRVEGSILLPRKKETLYVLPRFSF